jgi:hypothetical protein
VQIRNLDANGQTLAQVAAAVGVSTDTVRVALGRKRVVGVSDRSVEMSSFGGEMLSSEPDVSGGVDVDVSGDMPSGELELLAVPVPRIVDRGLARTGLLDEAPVVFTEGAGLPLAGLLLILPALAASGLLDTARGVYGRMRPGFYGLRATLLTLVFLAFLRDPRAEGATRIRPADLGRVLGLDRAPEVKTLRRKLSELAALGKGAELQGAMAKAHGRRKPETLGFFYIDGHVRVYTGKRDLPKTHIGRLHMAGRASVETHVADIHADPVLVVTATAGASLASELVGLIPDLRAVLGDDRRATVIFDRGGWSPATFATLIGAGFDILTYRKAPYGRLTDDQFTAVEYVDPEGVTHNYNLADTTVCFDLPKKNKVTLRQVTRAADDGAQIPILTSRTDLEAAEVCWRLAARWRHENYFKYARTHFALDVLDSYADMEDDPNRMVVNPAKTQAVRNVEAARTDLTAANCELATAIADAATRAGLPGAGGKADINPKALKTLNHAQTTLNHARTDSRHTPTHLTLATIRPNARVLNEERKLLTHAIRMAAYNTETTLVRMITPHYARAEDEARALLREAVTLSGDIEIIHDVIHVRLDPATAPRRSRALAQLCDQLTATNTTYPDTNLTLKYTIKNHPTHP